MAFLLSFYYKKFWPLISEPFIKCVNECFETKELSSSQKQAEITLIEKEAKIEPYEKTGGRFLY